MKGIYLTLMNGIERLKSQGEILSDMLEALRYVWLLISLFGGSKRVD